mgnify:CR=1 FL=1
MMALISGACVGNIDGVDDDDFFVVYLEDEDNYVVVVYLDGYSLTNPSHVHHLMSIGIFVQTMYIVNRGRFLVRKMM